MFSISVSRGLSSIGGDARLRLAFDALFFSFLLVLKKKRDDSGSTIETRDVGRERSSTVSSFAPFPKNDGILECLFTSVTALFLLNVGSGAMNVFSMSAAELGSSTVRTELNSREAFREEETLLMRNMECIYSHGPHKRENKKFERK